MPSLLIFLRAPDRFRAGRSDHFGARSWTFGQSAKNRRERALSTPRALCEGERGRQSASLPTWVQRRRRLARRVQALWRRRCPASRIHPLDDAGSLDAGCGQEAASMPVLYRRRRRSMRRGRALLCTFRRVSDGDLPQRCGSLGSLVLVRVLLQLSLQLLDVRERVDGLG